MVRKTSTFILLALILISSFVIMNISSPVEAVGGNAKVYIICLPNVGGSALSTPYDPSKTRDGAIEALSFKEDNNVPRVHPKFGKTPPFFSVDYVVVTSWSLYKTIIESPDYKGIIIINTHGEKLPIPSGYNSPSEWVDKISDAMLKRRVTWVHTAGYPFYYYYYQNGGEGTWGEDGFKYFMGKIGKGSVNCETPSGH